LTCFVVETRILPETATSLHRAVSRDELGRARPCRLPGRLWRALLRVITVIALVLSVTLRQPSINKVIDEVGR
jgi:hypothetical protein